MPFSSTPATTLIYGGLTDDQVIQSRTLHGSNYLEGSRQRLVLSVFKGIVSEPMFLLLVAACSIYFAVGQHQEGIIMLVSVFIVSGISFYQEYRSRSAISSLRKISSAKCTVIRNNKTEVVSPADLVVDDIVRLNEGEIIPADGLVLSSNDFLINESILTGETFSVPKSEQNSKVFRGTLVTGGYATVKITAVGSETEFGKIHRSLEAIDIVKTPLQLQIKSFVKNMALFGIAAFVIVVLYHFWKSENFIQSLLQGLTLAMSVLPEEIPVAFSTFQALGAFRLLKSSLIVKHPQYVETLGSATVICVDKTGTLTKNEMVIAATYDAVNKKETDVADIQQLPAELIEYAMWGSEVIPFDPMEKAIHQLYSQTATFDKRPEFKQTHEYPLGGHPPFMTHIFTDNSGKNLIAAKGAPEAIIDRSNLDAASKQFFKGRAKDFATKGYRVIGVAKAAWPNNVWPQKQEEFLLNFLGLIIFDDPPKAGISETISGFLGAGIQVKLLTGDYPETALAIANKAGIISSGPVISGDTVINSSDKELKNLVNKSNLFARMFPEAKLRVINALKQNGDVVAMTGDGVNDAPALKAAQIGIAMGKKGSEVAKNASALIIADDNLSHMVEAVAMGRKIYDNLKKAIRYIVSIHVPIILIVVIPLLLNWTIIGIFSPVHVIFLELLMGPTCSIVYENEPIEPGTMKRMPRKLTDTFLTLKQLGVSVVQGVIIAAGCLALGFYYLENSANERLVRTVVFETLLFSNIMLTLVNRSFTLTLAQTIKYKNKLVVFILSVTLLMVILSLSLPPVQLLFNLDSLTLRQVLLCIVTAVVCTVWIEVWKYYRLRYR